MAGGRAETAVWRTMHIQHQSKMAIWVVASPRLMATESWYPRWIDMKKTPIAVSMTMVEVFESPPQEMMRARVDKGALPLANRRRTFMPGLSWVGSRGLFVYSRGLLDINATYHCTATCFGIMMKLAEANNLISISWMQRKEKREKRKEKRKNARESTTPAESNSDGGARHKTEKGSLRTRARYSWRPKVFELFRRVNHTKSPKILGWHE